MSLWYRLLRSYVRLGLFMYFQEIRIIGRENIPATGPMMFTVNHQNAFLDALLVATSNRRHTHFLVRADLFKFRLARKFFATLNMMPVYRIRDGRQSLHHNHQVFERCFTVLKHQQAIMLFPEANHHQKRLLLPLSKGFTRIALGIDEPISIIPVGINYTHHSVFGGSVSLYYGSPISTGAEKDHRSLTRQVKDQMQKLITNIPENQHYQKYEDYLNQHRWLYLDPYRCNQWINDTDPSTLPSIKTDGPDGILRLLAKGISSLFNFLPILVHELILHKLKDPVFSSSIKFITGIVLLPWYYLVLAILLYCYVGPVLTAMVLILGILSLIARKRTVPY